MRGVTGTAAEDSTNPSGIPSDASQPPIHDVQTTKRVQASLGLARWQRNRIGNIEQQRSGQANQIKSSSIPFDRSLLVAASSSRVMNQILLQTTRAATITSSVNRSAGQAITFTAKITSPLVVPTGPVTHQEF